MDVCGKVHAASVLLHIKLDGYGVVSVVLSEVSDNLGCCQQILVMIVNSILDEK